MRGDYSTSVEAVDDFIINIHALAKLRRALKNRINVKTSGLLTRTKKKCINSTFNKHLNRSVSSSCTKYNEWFRD